VRESELPASGPQLYRLNLLGLLALRGADDHEHVTASAAHRLLAGLKRKGLW
jgi:hypothetical protein